MITTILSYISIFILFCIDQTTAYLFEEVVLNSLLAVYISSCFKNVSWLYRSFIIFFI